MKCSSVTHPLPNSPTPYRDYRVSDESLKRKGVEANKLQAHLKKLPTGMVRVTSQSISLFQGEDESTVEVLYTEVTPVML